MPDQKTHQPTTPPSSLGSPEHSHPSVRAARAISPEQYQAWLAHPVSRVVRQFYRDYVREVERNVLAQWRAGALVAEAENRGRAAAAHEMADLPYESIQGFYDRLATEEETR